jgi:orotate phosphoribosyltransferase
MEEKKKWSGIDWLVSRVVDRRMLLADYLLSTECVRFGSFRLKLHEKNPDAPLSPIYFDLRRLQSFPEILRLSARCIADLFEKSDAEKDSNGLCVSKELMDNPPYIAGIPLAGVPLATAVSLLTSRPMITPRLEKKSHGSGDSIDGVISGERKNVSVIDDLITKADSKLEAISVLENGGLVIEGVYVLVDRMQGGVKELEGRGYKVKAALTIAEILDRYSTFGTGPIAKIEETRAYFGL